MSTRGTFIVIAIAITTLIAGVGYYDSGTDSDFPEPVKSSQYVETSMEKTVHSNHKESSSDELRSENASSVERHQTAQEQQKRLEDFIIPDQPQGLSAELEKKRLEALNDQVDQDAILERARKAGTGFVINEEHAQVYVQDDPSLKGLKDQVDQQAIIEQAKLEGYLVDGTQSSLSEVTDDLNDSLQDQVDQAAIIEKAKREGYLVD